MDHDDGVSEIIGAILLISVLVAAFGIFAALYIPTLVPEKVPYIKLSMACNVSTGSDDVDFPCTRGTFNCDPNPFNNKTCEDDCHWRDYSVNPDIDRERYEREVSRCMENCMSPLCSDLKNCAVLYICHNGGNLIEVSKISIVVNGNRIINHGIPTAEDTWEIKKQDGDDTFTTPSPDMNFSNGDSFRITAPSHGSPVDSVMFLYTLKSGGETTLAQNQFGTDII